MIALSSLPTTCVDCMRPVEPAYQGTSLTPRCEDCTVNQWNRFNCHGSPPMYERGNAPATRHVKSTIREVEQLFYAPPIRIPTK